MKRLARSLAGERMTELADFVSRCPDKNGGIMRFRTEGTGEIG